jgi:signal transduction histidine kinase
MLDFFRSLLSDDFMPHGQCMRWDPAVLWLHVLADLAIVASYFSIPLGLVVFARRRGDLRFGWLLSMFGAFILACGLTHAFEIWTLWHPVYRLEAVVKTAAAVISVATAIALWRSIPAALAVPSFARLQDEIIERHHAEAEVRRINEELEARVAARTRELARSNEELEQFAYVASHDLREPLRMVKSYAELLSRRYSGKLGDDADEFIHYIVDGADRMRALMTDMLEYSRVDRRLSPIDADTEHALRIAMDNLALAIDQAGAVVTHDRLPPVRCTPSQLAQLLQNLLDNAIKYRKDGPPRVHVSAQSTDREVILCVRDEGIGFDPAHHDRIFGMFQRLHPHGTYPGTGMGLALCKKIVESHGGRIWGESEPGRGSAFYCAFPHPKEAPA